MSSSCLRLVAKLDERDQDAILTRLDQLQAEGVPAERAQIQAAIDVLTGLKRLAGIPEDQDLDPDNPGIKRSAARDVTETPEFKRWFGDSRVVDADGRPLVVYHGGAKGITAFDKGKIGTNFGYDKDGFFFTTERGDYPGTADNYAGEDGDVYHVYLSLQNPYTLEQFAADLGLEVDDLVMQEGSPQSPITVFDTDREEIMRRVRDGGYDGVAFQVDYGDGTNEGMFVALEPTQIKSAIGNNGQFDQGSADITLSTARNPMGFYSALARGIEAMPTKQAPAGAWKTQIKGLVNKGIVKQDEIEWSGIDDWLDLQDGKVSKEAVAEYLKQGGVKVEEVVLGDDDAEERARIAYYTSQRELMESAKELESIIPKDLPANARANLVAWVYSSANGDEYAQDEIDKLELSGDVKNGIRRHMALAVAHDLASRKFSDSEPSKYGDYTIPGGENYREVLLILPSKNPVLGMSSMRASRILFGQRYDSLTESQKSELRRKVSGKDDPEPYRSGHWDQSNVIAHIRVNDRTDDDGKRVLFVEELQSDWQADNRKAKDAIKAAVEDDFQGIVDRMKKAGVLEVNCD